MVIFDEWFKNMLILDLSVFEGGCLAEFRCVKALTFNEVFGVVGERGFF